ncbi:hypothetical protein CBR_g51384 [Chara braunii]|uniref:Uncharacterized protein n=1 Tax=Chara braunii TaxID=69332 RepID=A0A388M8G8_CHABU|nr:hypothetical protein CBR_g51384 [Chara braunii]|eukprot:GBG90878.1 hypothetical protein CBR_g51384 [Chara braunii]
MKLEEENIKKLKEEEDRKEEWRKECARLEEEMGARLDKRLEKVCPHLINKDDGMVSPNEELVELKKENEKLRRLLLGDDNHADEDKMMRLQREIAGLRRQVAEKKLAEDDIFALRQEIDQLRGTTLVKTNFEQEIAGLKKEIGLLGEVGTQAREEAELWKGEALRPRNKRGCYAVGTRDCAVRGSPKPRWMDNLRDNDKWKQEYFRMKEKHRVASFEAEVLKEKRANAKAEVIKLQDEMGKLSVISASDQTECGDTNLKSRLEAVANRSVRKGGKATSMREGCSQADGAAEVNERFAFIEEQKKCLRQYKKSTLEIQCKETGLKMGMVKPMIAELAEYHADKAFGKHADIGKTTVPVEVSNGSATKNAVSAADDDRFVEL